MRLVKHLLSLSQLRPSSMAMMRIILVVCCCAASGRAQSDKQPQRGYSPGGAYALSEIETISATAGNMMLKIPLAALPPGRGGSPGFALNLFYNSKIYDPITQTMPNRMGQMTTQMFMDASPGGNWQFGLRYELEVFDKRDEYRYIAQNGPSCGTDFQNFPKLVKVRMRFPDGGTHEFRPLGEAAHEKDGYYSVAPNGSRYRCSNCTSCPTGAILETSPASYATRTYYSADGTYLRLVISYAPPDANGHRAEYWTLSFPDGGYVTNDLGPASSPNLGNRIYDRNGNYTEIISSGGSGNQAAVITDQLGRKITVEWDEAAKQNYIYSPGFGIGNERLKTTVKWKDIRVNKTIRSGGIYNSGGDDYAYNRSFRVVEQILLPQQSGGLAYGFSYNADSSSPSNGWGEVSSVTLPTGARADYTYRMDGLDSLNANVVLKNHPVRKSLTYLEEYDGVTQEKTDHWAFQLGTGSIESYNNNGHSQMRGPDGGVVSESFYAVEDSSNPFKGLVYRIGYADGSVVEKLWRTNNVREVDTQGSSSANPYVKSEYSSIRDAGGNLTKTTVKDYNYDKNGNVTRVKEYDWAAYGSVHDGSGSPLWDAARPAIKRDTVNAYYRATPDADSATLDPDAYHQPTAPRLRAALSSSEVSDGAQAVSRTELYYDDSATAGNLIEQRSWDSHKGGTYKAITRPLGEGGADNYVSVSHEYDENAVDPALRYGNRTLTVDARANKTKFTYGPVNGVGGLYPTEVRAAYGTTVEQVTTAEYDFETGLVTRATDPNGVATTTAYDAFGRPTWLKRAVNTPAESHTRVIYSDAERRVITRSNLSSLSDARLVSVEHYDQLGRVRLTRKLENSNALITDAPAAVETDESVGIKVQARYFSVNPCHPQNTAECVAANGQHMASYQLVSNPYRAATSAAASAETTMGWARSKSDRGGRVVEAETFAGGGLPAPWAADPGAANTASTGKVVTSYDAEHTTVTDQQGKPRRGVTDALGRLLRVDEPTAAGLGEPAAPNQPTCYAYDALSNLTGVRQGGQWQAGQCQNSPQADRTFQYSSLSRLTSASNPEGGVVNYTYYDDGSLKTRTDARGVTATLLYDELGRVTSRSYTSYTTAQGETISTPSVSYFYDSQWPAAAGAPTLDRGLSKGRLVAVTYGGGADGTYLGGYDAAGRVTKSAQRTDAQVYSFPSYAYDLAGNLTSQTYPSGSVVATEYDSAGRFAGVKDAGAGRYWAGGAPGAKAVVSYAAHGALAGVRLGNGLWEGTGFNSRLQPTSISLDAKIRTTTDHKSLVLRYTYGLMVDGVLDAAKNNGNVESQTVIIPDPADQRNDLLRVTQSYEYDEVNRLKSARETTASTGAQVWRQVYAYDRFGNRTLAQGTTAPALPPGVMDAYWNPSISQGNNRINSLGYDYDQAGNLTQTLGAIAGTTSRAVFDAENLMVSYRLDQNIIAQYAYDGDGRRVRKMTGGVTTVFVYDATGKLAAEYSSGQPQANGTQYLTADNLGSPRVVTGEKGDVVARHDFRPFGEEIGAGEGGRGNVAGYGRGDNLKQKFTGKERDTETSLDYFGARYYTSTQGRFTTVDPLLSSGGIDAPQSWNRYSYTLNNPLKYTDPLGLYVFDKSVDEGQRNQFNAALEQARENLKKIAKTYGINSKEYGAAKRSLDVYGQLGVKNGVTIVAQSGVGAGRTKVDGVAGPKTADNPTGQNIKVEIDPSEFNAESLQVHIGHEGSHAADGADWIASGFAASKHPMWYQSEVDAYTVSSLILEAQYPNSSGANAILPGALPLRKGLNPYLPEFIKFYSAGWAEADKATLRRSNIDSYLARPRSRGGDYGLTPASKEKIWRKGYKFP